MPATPTITLANGVAVPAVAAGCAFGNWTGGSDFQGFLPEQAWAATRLAVDNGVRHFDGAHAYGTERQVGSVLGGYWMRGELDRGDVFLTSKIAHPSAPPHVNISHLRTWNAREVSDVRQRLLDDLAVSLGDLGVGQLDLLLLHWPGAFGETDAVFARRTRAVMWRTLCEVYGKKAARAIGVCNFTKKHLEELEEDLKDEDGFVRPMVNQIEYNPYCQDRPLLAYCQAKDIVVEAFAPLASGALGLVQDATIKAIGERYGKTIGQTILRWLVQQGIIILPKSSKAHRIRENMDVFDFELSEEDMAAITALGDGEARRTCPDPSTIL